MRTEVLIAGAGPVGLTLALELSRYGVSVRIVDKAPARNDKSRAVVLWSRTLELLERSGSSEVLVAAGTQAKAANIVTGGRTIGRIELDGADTPFPFALMLPQSETERLLEEQLNKLGVKVERDIELASFTADTDKIAATLRRSGKNEESVESLWLVGCDGARSNVRQGLHMVFTGDAQPSTWILADVGLRGVRDVDEIQVGWHSDGILAIFPMGHGRWRIIADAGSSQSAGPPPDPTLDEVQSVLDKRFAGLWAYDPTWLSSNYVNERKVVKYRSGRVFLAGDAAHVHNPAGGQGMNTGIQDAVNLAWKLALVCRGICTEEPLLDSYSAERSAVGEHVLKNTGRLTSLAILRGDVRQSIRNHVASILFGFEPLRSAMADTFSALSIGYADSPLNVQGPIYPTGPEPGQRASIRTGEPPFGVGDRPLFALCADVTEDAARRSASVTAGLYRDLIEEDVRAPFTPGGVWLVRPDGYVAFSARATEWDRVAAYLDGMDWQRRLIQRAATWSTWMRPGAKE